MPVIKSAKKKLRQDKRRSIVNKMLKERLKNVVKKAKKGVTPELIQTAFSVIDKSVKRNIIHRNKAARMKSSLSKLLAKAAPAPTKKPAIKKSAMKVAA